MNSTFLHLSFLIPRFFVYIIIFAAIWGERFSKEVRHGGEPMKMEELIDSRLLKGFGDDGTVIAIAIVYMNRHVIPLCRLHFMAFSRL